MGICCSCNKSEITAVISRTVSHISIPNIGHSKAYNNIDRIIFSKINNTNWNDPINLNIIRQCDELLVLLKKYNMDMYSVCGVERVYLLVLMAFFNQCIRDNEVYRHKFELLIRKLNITDAVTCRTAIAQYLLPYTITGDFNNTYTNYGISNRMEETDNFYTINNMNFVDILGQLIEPPPVRYVADEIIKWQRETAVEITTVCNPVSQMPCTDRFIEITAG